MPISFINAGGGSPASASLGVTPAVGDIILVLAYKNSTTAPSLPGAYTNISTSSGNSNSYRVGYKVSDGTETTTSTWTNASCVSYAIYRGVTGIGTSSGATKASASTADVPTIALTNINNQSWVVALVGSRQTTAQGTPAAGATSSRNTQAGTTAMAGIFDTNGVVRTFAATTSSNNTSVVSCGITVELMCASHISTLSDPLSDNYTPTTIWTKNNSADAAQVNEQNGRLEVAHNNTVQYNALESVVAYNFLSGSAFVKLVNAGNQSLAGHEAIFYAFTNATNKIWFAISGGSIYAVKLVANVQTTITSTTYNSTTHAYLRLREASGTLYWDTSPDGSVWTNFTSLANPFGSTTMVPGMQAGAWQAEASGSFAYFNNFNILNSVPSAMLAVF